jgi:hypothetical protein
MLVIIQNFPCHVSCPKLCVCQLCRGITNFKSVPFGLYLIVGYVSKRYSQFLRVSDYKTLPVFESLIIRHSQKLGVSNYKTLSVFECLIRRKCYEGVLKIYT